MSKKNALRLSLAIGLFFGLAYSGSQVIADEGDEGSDEDLYFVDIVEPEDGWSRIFWVKINDKKERVELYPFIVKNVKGPFRGAVPLNTVKALAASLDNQRLYLIDHYEGKQFSGTGLMGYYDIRKQLYEEVGFVVDKLLKPGEPVKQITMAAFSPLDGKLYAGSEATESLYIVDTEADGAGIVKAERLGKVFLKSTGKRMNLLGADLAFDLDGQLYIWTNAKRQRGFYKVFLPKVPGGKIIAELVKKPDDHHYTGLAFRFNGRGDAVASTSSTIRSDIEPHFHIFPKDKPRKEGVLYDSKIKKGKKWVFYHAVLGDLSYPVPGVGEPEEECPDCPESECDIYTTAIFAGQHFNAGSVKVTIEGDDLVVVAEATGGWSFSVIQIYAGTEAPGSSSPGSFPYKYSFGTNQTTFGVKIPLSDFGGECTEIHVAVHLNMHKGEQSETGWAEGENKFGTGWGGWFVYGGCCE